MKTPPQTEHTMKAITLSIGLWLVIFAVVSAVQGDGKSAIWFAVASAMAIFVGLVEGGNRPRTP